MKNFNLEEFKEVVEKYNDYKQWLQYFIIENRDIFAAICSDVENFDCDSIITNIGVNNEKFNITAMNDYGWGEFGTVSIELPIECLMNKDDVKKKEFMLYLKLKQKYEK